MWMEDGVKMSRFCSEIAQTDSVKWHSVILVYFPHLGKIQALVFGEAP